MTKKEYLNWIKTRDPNPSTWDYATCKAADACIKRETLENLNDYLKKQSIDPALKSWIKLMVGHNFGYAETAQLLRSLNLYPDWMGGQ